MDRVKRQLGCSEKIQYSVATEDICVAVLDTGERVIILLKNSRIMLTKRGIIFLRHKEKGVENKR